MTLTPTTSNYNPFQHATRDPDIDPNTPLTNHDTLDEWINRSARVTYKYICYHQQDCYIENGGDNYFTAPPYHNKGYELEYVYYATTLDFGNGRLRFFVDANNTIFASYINNAGQLVGMDGPSHIMQAIHTYGELCDWLDCIQEYDRRYNPRTEENAGYNINGNGVADFVE